MKAKGEFKIEKNIPVPPLRDTHSKYPFGEMNIGDSIFVPHKAGAGVNPVVSAAAYYGNKNNKKFTTKNEEKGTRVWRIK